MENLKESGSYKARIILILMGIIFIAAALLMGLSDNIPAILLFLAGCFSFVFGIIFDFGKSKNLRFRNKLLYWSPRIICILFLLFMSLFALDVGSSRGFWQTTLAFTMHLIPSFLLAAILIITWKREWIGAIIFPVLGISYIFMFWSRHLPIVVYLVISGILFMIGLLFFLNWKYRSSVRPLH